MKKLLLATLCLAFTATQAFALDLGQARQQKLVGERTDGYIQSRKDTPSAEVKTLVKDVNNKRRKKYQEISKKNGQTLDIVEALAAEKIRKRLNKGQYYLDEDGDWQQKKTAAEK